MSSFSRAQMRSSIAVGAPESVFAARRLARRYAHDMGFDPRTAEELAVVVTELATNMLKYAGRGRIELSIVGDLTRGPGIGIVAEDEGALFDLERALPDGYDGAGMIDPALLFGRRGIGAGLGAIARLTDGLKLEKTQSGKRLVAVRYIRRAGAR